jgi:hypothetical protein
MLPSAEKADAVSSEDAAAALFSVWSKMSY